MVLIVGAAVESGSSLALLGIGAVLIAMVYAGRHQSGGHYNPAVTLAALVRRRIGLREAVAYWVVQFGAGLLAAAVVRTIVDPTRAAATAAITLTGHTLVAAFAVELLVTFALCYVATSRDHPDGSTAWRSDSPPWQARSRSALSRAVRSTRRCHSARP